MHFPYVFSNKITNITDRYKTRRPQIYCNWRIGHQLDEYSIKPLTPIPQASQNKHKYQIFDFANSYSEIEFVGIDTSHTSFSLARLTFFLYSPLKSSSGKDTRVLAIRLLLCLASSVG